MASLRLPELPGADAPTVWAALMDATRTQATLGWMDLFRLESLVPTTAGLQATITPVRGGDIARKSASPARLTRLGELLGQIVRQPVRVTLSELDAPGTQDTDHAVGSGRSSDRLDRDSAFRMPAVREILDVFPDAVVLSVRKQTPAPGIAPDHAEND